MKRFRDHILNEQKKPQNMTFAQIKKDVETTIKPGHSSPMGRLAMQGDKPVVYRAQHSAQGIVGDKEGYESVDPTPLRQMHRGYAKRIRQLRMNEMKALDTEAGRQLVAQVGKKQAKKRLRQEITSQVVSHIERQGLSAGRAQRTRQTRELLTRPTVGIDDSIRYADLSKKNPRLTQ